MTREEFNEHIQVIRDAAYLAESGSLEQYVPAGIRSDVAIQKLWSAIEQAQEDK